MPNIKNSPQDEYLRSRLRLAARLIRLAEVEMLGATKGDADSAEFALMSATEILVGEQDAHCVGLDGFIAGWLKGMRGDSK